MLPHQHQSNRSNVWSTLDTSEARWFVDGSLPQDHIDWFTGNGATVSEDCRIDHYLVNGSRDQGVKRRHGRLLEVKTRFAVHPGTELVAGIVATVEEYRKERRGDAPDAASEAQTWIDISKSTLKRSFWWDGDGVVVATEGPDTGIPGCHVDLTSIEAGPTAAWSLAYEAYGPSELRMTILKAAAEAIEAETPHPRGLVESLGANMGYASWLQKLCAESTISLDMADGA